MEAPTGAIDISTMQVECPGCGGQHTSTKRLVEGYTGVFEVGVRCPVNGSWWHSFYTNTQLIKQRQAILKHGFVFNKTGDKTVERRGRKAEKKYEAAHKKFNAMMRRRMGTLTVVTS